MYFTWIVFQLAIGYNLLIPAVLLVISKFNRTRRSEPESALYDFAVIVTAYQQTELLGSTLRSILNVRHSNYHVYLVADNCDISGLTITHPRLTILRPKETLANNIKSHFYAINRFERKHDIVTIIDSDNLMHPDYLTELSLFFRQGFKAVQGRRLPKNLDTHLARLDAARDVYYDFYDGNILFKAGSSSTLSGSGMGFLVSTYQDCLQGVDISGAGFDKVLQARLVSTGQRIAHAPGAIVYDQKTSNAGQFVAQRSRWMNSWFKYMYFGLALFGRGMMSMNWNQALFGLILLRPPLVVFLVTSLLCLIMNLFFAPILSLLWLSALSCFLFTFIVALKTSEHRKQLSFSMLHVPKFVFLQLKSLWYLRSANRRSVATNHSPLKFVKYD